MNILIGTKNKGKIEGAKKAFKRYFNDVTIEGISVESEVADQPVNDEILQGARNRVKNLKKYAEENNLEADFFVAMESGITDKFGTWLNLTTVYIENKDEEGAVGFGPAYPIPARYIEEIKEKELSYVLAELFETKEIKAPRGGIAQLSHGQVSRIDLAEQGFIMALTHFINGEIWK